MRFAHLTAPEIKALDRDRTLVVAPIAACEQHSRHLPVITDTVLCGAVADGVEASRPDRVLLLPVLWIGASDHHLPFGGTLTSTLPNYEALLIDLVTPLLADGFGRVLLLNGHGGNIDPLHVALRRLNVSFPRAVLTGAAYWEIAEAEIAALCAGPRKSMGHACEIETSMMMHLRPELVRTELIEDDPCPNDLPGVFRAQDFADRTDHGAVGFPSYADAGRGREMLEAIIGRVTETVDRVLRV